jgi:hypothetical protein
LSNASNVSNAEQLEATRAEHAAQMDEQAKSYQEQLQVLQQDLASQETDALQTMESSLVEMEQMQAKLDEAQRRISELEAAANYSNNSGASTVEELEAAAAQLQAENEAEMARLKEAHAQQLDKMTKERAILIREVKKLQKAVQDKPPGGADAAEVAQLKQDLANKDALLAQQGEEIEALVAMQAEAGAFVRSCGHDGGACARAWHGGVRDMRACVVACGACGARVRVGDHAVVVVPPSHHHTTTTTTTTTANTTTTTTTTTITTTTTTTTTHLHPHHPHPNRRGQPGAAHCRGRGRCGRRAQRRPGDAGAGDAGVAAAADGRFQRGARRPLGSHRAAARRVCHRAAVHAAAAGRAARIVVFVVQAGAAGHRR